jgi:hypothetical protein
VWEIERKLAEDGARPIIFYSRGGQYLYVGNFVEGDIDVLRHDGDTLAKVGSLALPGHPASMRGTTP